MITSEEELRYAEHELGLAERKLEEAIIHLARATSFHRSAMKNTADNYSRVSEARARMAAGNIVFE